jgi:tRNA(fMet)-specific endonuclease VapC
VADPAYLLDTNICIFAVRGVPHVINRIADSPRGTLATSIVCVAELLVGAGGSMTDAYAALFKAMEPVPFEWADARAYATLPFKRHRFDHLIAAQALARGLTLVTNNEADFAGIPGLHVDNWARP